MAFELHPLSPWPSQNRAEEEFLYRLGRMVQALGYTPLFILDRGFDRVGLMGRLKAWGMRFLIRRCFPRGVPFGKHRGVPFGKHPETPLRRHREVKTKAGEGFLLEERYSEVVRPWRERVDLHGSGGGVVEVELFVAGALVSGLLVSFGVGSYGLSSADVD